MAVKKITANQGGDAERWRTWTLNAYDAVNGHDPDAGYLRWLKRLPLAKVLERKTEWIYDHYEHISDLLSTGISTEQLARSMARCRCIAHRSCCEVLIPSWLRPGTVEYIKLLKRSGLDETRSRQREFLSGFTDRRGNWWCGLCYWRQRCMDAAEMLSYIDAHSLYAVPETRGVVGYVEWLALVGRSSDVLVGTLAAAAERARMPLIVER